MPDPFRQLDDYPVCRGAMGILVRLVDGIGFRFRWASEGLREEDHAFSPGEGAMTIGELVGHVWGLAQWIAEHVAPEDASRRRPEDPATLREEALALWLAVRERFALMGEAAFFELRIGDHPIWHIVNGPLADTLTHVGQIAVLRRLNGNPVPSHKVFTGTVD